MPPPLPLDVPLVIVERLLTFKVPALVTISDVAETLLPSNQKVITF